MDEKQPMTMYQLKKDLIEQLQVEKEQILSAEYPEDLLYEFVDGAVPIYYYQLLELAIDDTYIATNEPDLLAYDGKPTPINAIAGNVYEALRTEAYEWLEEVKEREEIRQGRVSLQD